MGRHWELDLPTADEADIADLREEDRWEKLNRECPICGEVGYRGCCSAEY